MPTRPHPHPPRPQSYDDLLHAAGGAAALDSDPSARAGFGDGSGSGFEIGGGGSGGRGVADSRVDHGTAGAQPYASSGLRSSPFGPAASGVHSGSSYAGVPGSIRPGPRGGSGGGFGGPVGGVGGGIDGVGGGFGAGGGGGPAGGTSLPPTPAAALPSRPPLSPSPGISRRPSATSLSWEARVAPPPWSYSWVAQHMLEQEQLEQAEQLPPGWRSGADASCGRQCYFHLETRSSR